MPEGWKKFIQPQKPMSAMLVALVGPTLWGIYCFGWYVLAAVLVCSAVCWACEYYFTRKSGKPATSAAIVTGTLLALVLPPYFPLHYAALGAFFAIVFGKMAFGGFGKNIFNPAMVGRCFLYILVPGLMTAQWFGPVEGPAGGLTTFGPVTEAAREARVKDQPVDEIQVNKLGETVGINVEAVTGATTLAGTKQLNEVAQNAKKKLSQVRDEIETLEQKDSKKDELEALRKQEQRQQTILGVASGSIIELSIGRLFVGRMAGSMGETGALIILLSLVYLLLKKTVKWQLVVSPLVGMLLGTILYTLLGRSVLPMGEMLLINLFAGGTLFAVVYMTTEPVSAPMDNTARWIYGILIGFLAVTIRTIGAWNAGFMFAILMGNMFGPIIEIAVNEARAWLKGEATNG